MIVKHLSPLCARVAFMGTDYKLELPNSHMSDLDIITRLLKILEYPFYAIYEDSSGCFRVTTRSCLASPLYA